MDRPLVSIIVNNYNYARFLPEAIDSALGQTYPRIEVIVVDDGSTDDSRNVIEFYRGRVIPVLKSNGGQASAFNAGFEASHGDLVLFLDADDVLLPHCIERAAGFFARDPGSVAKVHFRLRVIDETGRDLGVLAPRPNERLPRGDLREPLRRRGQTFFPPTSGNLFSRRALDPIMPILENEFRICADNYVCNLAPLFGRVEAIDQPLAQYRVHSSNGYAIVGAVTDDCQLAKAIRSKEIEFHGLWKVCERFPHLFCPYVGPKAQVLHLMATAATARQNRSSVQAARLAARALPLLLVNHGIPLRRRVVGAAWLLAVGALPRALAMPLIRRTYAGRHRTVAAPPPAPMAVALKGG